MSRQGWLLSHAELSGPTKRRMMTAANLKSRRPLVLEGATNVGPLAELMTVRLRRVDVLLARGYATVAAGRNLRSGMISSLSLIVANPGISQNEISHYTGIDKSAIVGIVNRFEELGWVVRRKSETDKRRHDLHATPAGEAELKEIAAMIRGVEDKLLAQVPREDLDQLAALLDRTYEACLAAIQEP